MDTIYEILTTYVIIHNMIIDERGYNFESLFDLTNVGQGRCKVKWLIFCVTS
jgi:hypothetical protein